MKTSTTIIRAILTAILGTTLVYAIDVTWDGNSDVDGGDNSTWGDVNNWSTGALPGSNDKAFFDGLAPATITMGADRTVNNLDFGAGQTADVFLSGNRVAAFSVNIRSGAGAVSHSLTRWQLRGSMTANIEGANQKLTALNLESSFNDLTKNGSGTLQIGNWINSNQRADIIINAGTVDLQSDLSLSGGNPNGIESLLLSGSSGTLLTNSSATQRTFRFGRANSQSAVFDGAVTGNAIFELGHTSTTDRTNFSGQQTLTGNNTYTGATVVNQGTLIINGTTSGQGSYTVRGTTSASTGGIAKTGTLGGTGTIGLASAATFTIGSASQLSGSLGVLYPGADNTDTGFLSIGTDLSNDVIFSDYSILRLDIGAGTASDRVNITGNLNLSGSLDTLGLMTLAGAGGAGLNYTLATYSGSLSGIFNTVQVNGTPVGDPNNFALGSNSYKVSYDSGAISLVAIPEPGTLVLLLCGFGTFLATRITRRRS